MFNLNLHSCKCWVLHIHACKLYVRCTCIRYFMSKVLKTSAYLSNVMETRSRLPIRSTVFCELSCAFSETEPLKWKPVTRRGKREGDEPRKESSRISQESATLINLSFSFLRIFRLNCANRAVVLCTVVLHCKLLSYLGQRVAIHIIYCTVGREWIYTDT